jgi:hypothetical protein
MGLGFFSLINQIIPMMNSYNSATFSDWSVLSFNVRGINSVVKGNGTHYAIRDSRCDIVCLQETKKEFFDRAGLRKFYPNSLDAFAFVPSVGNSGHFITVWNSCKLAGTVIFRMSMLFRLNSLLIHPMNPGLSLIFTRPILRMGKSNFLTGSLISICPRKSSS